MRDKRLFLTGFLFIAVRKSAEALGMVDLDPLESRDDFTMVVRLHHLFDAATIPVFAQWWTGRLVAATGRMTAYIHQGFASSYASYRVFRVVRGRVNSVRDFDGREWARRSGMRWYGDDDECSGDKLEEEDDAIADWRQERDRGYRMLLRYAEEIRALDRPYDSAPPQASGVGPLAVPRS